MRILIAEDDLASRTYLFKLLSQIGECDLVVDGMEALDAYLISIKENKPYHLICLDIMMPKVDGVKVLKHIKDFDKHKGISPKKSSKVIMTTALAETALVQTSYELGCDAYISKPIDTKKLLDIVRELGFHEEVAGIETDQLS
ncbi:MAG: response regulator [Herbinix sp.]|jgi:two-component system chemotaxis response regulator CheY|nr:response regulator [Herbinix sp.]